MYEWDRATASKKSTQLSIVCLVVFISFKYIGCDSTKMILHSSLVKSSSSIPAQRKTAFSPAMVI